MVTVIACQEIFPLTLRREASCTSVGSTPSTPSSYSSTMELSGLVVAKRFFSSCIEGRLASAMAARSASMFCMLAVTCFEAAK